MMLPAGEYYVGDLCYVMHDEWDEVCSLLFKGRTDHGCNQGEFMLKDGRRFAIFNTKYGDGGYRDQFNNNYDVDAGSIGCILIKDLDLNSDENYTSGGNVIKMEKDFNSLRVDGTLTFGHIVIDTDGSLYDEEEEEEEYND